MQGKREEGFRPHLTLSCRSNLHSLAKRRRRRGFSRAPIVAHKICSIITVRKSLRHRIRHKNLYEFSCNKQIPYGVFFVSGYAQCRSEFSLTAALFRERLLGAPFVRGSRRVVPIVLAQSLSSRVVCIAEALIFCALLR